MRRRRARRGSSIRLPAEKEERYPLIPQDIRARLEDHQVEGVMFLSRNLKAKRGSLLADYMGLGKTVQCLVALSAYLRHEKKGRRHQKVLLVTPAVVANNWVKEIEKWLPGRPEMVPFELTGKGSSHRTRTISKWDDFGGILLTSYESFRSAIENYKIRHPNDPLSSPLVDPKVVILDEGHRIRSMGTQITDALAHIRTPQKIVLTGYPLQTRLIEYWSLIDFIQPGLLGPLQNFRELFAIPIAQGQGKPQNSPESITANKRIIVLQEKVRDIVLRRGPDLLKKYLPPKREFVIWCMPSAAQLRIFNECIASASEYHNSESGYLRVYNLERLLFNHPIILYDYMSSTTSWTLLERRINQKLRSWGSNDKYKIDDSGKIMVLFTLLVESFKRSENAIIFSRSIPSLDFIYEILEDCNDGLHDTSITPLRCEILRLDGKTPLVVRSQIIERFNSEETENRENSAISGSQNRSNVTTPAKSENMEDRLREKKDKSYEHSIKVLLVSTKAGGEGINLVGGSRVIIMDVSWNPCDDIQAIQRCYR
ncbi:hypothetical protein AAMO2058_000733300 [Amorphochlora amoebiformis]